MVVLSAAQTIAICHLRYIKPLPVLCACREPRYCMWLALYCIRRYGYSGPFYFSDPDESFNMSVHVHSNTETIFLHFLCNAAEDMLANRTSHLLTSSGIVTIIRKKKEGRNLCDVEL